MNQNIKRINLSFDLNRETDKKVYELIKGQQRKTSFIIRTVLQSKGIEQNTNINVIKQALREVISEEGFILKSNSTNEIKNETDSNVIPDDVFKMFDKI
jgi:hypothetical protein